MGALGYQSRVPTPDVEPGAVPACEFAECVGYGVESVDGRIGTVAAVLPPGRGRSDGVLLVKSGLLTCALRAISPAAVESVDTRRRRVILRARDGASS